MLIFKILEQHTLYETHYLLANLTDRGFYFHQAVTQLWAEIALNLAESVILPMDLTWYATYLKESFAQIKTTYGAKITANGGTLGKNFYYARYDYRSC